MKQWRRVGAFAKVLFSNWWSASFAVLSLASTLLTFTSLHVTWRLPAAVAVLMFIFASFIVYCKQADLIDAKYLEREPSSLAESELQQERLQAEEIQAEKRRADDVHSLQDQNRSLQRANHLLTAEIAHINSVKLRIQAILLAHGSATIQTILSELQMNIFGRERDQVTGILGALAEEGKIKRDTGLTGYYMLTDITQSKQ